ncbi:MAG TPA: alpha/beta hydrolase [Burkholderiales bacterium]|nr:alpha/beta hydrolase [Burkholderiales bacterium]
MKVRFIDVGGIRTRCLFAGSEKAYPLMLLHGYGGTADVWCRNIDELGEDFYVIAPDMIGQGFTDPMETGPVPPQGATVAHLRALAVKLGLRHFCPNGTSYGALIGALLYFDMPDRVDRLVINGSASCFNDDAALLASYRKVLDTFGPVMDAPSVEACRRAMARQVYDPSTVLEEALLTMATAYAQPWMRKSWAQGLEGLMKIEQSRPWQIRQRLKEFDVDTLVVWGLEDPGAAYSSAVDAVRQMPRAKLVTFEKCGHKPMFEHPHEYHRALRAFLHDKIGKA